jgi:nucleoside-diphosphate-sugar epimerase
VRALLGHDLTIYGNGSQTRSFCYVDDLIEGMMRLMNVDGLTGPVNIGNPSEFTIRELAEKVVQKLQVDRSWYFVIFRLMIPDRENLISDLQKKSCNGNRPLLLSRV